MLTQFEEQEEDRDGVKWTFGSMGIDPGKKGPENGNLCLGIIV